MYDIPQALSCKEISDYLGVFGWILYQRLVSDERVSNVQDTPIWGVISITGGKRGDSLIPPVQGCLLALLALLGVQRMRYTPIGVVPHTVLLPHYRDNHNIASTRQTKSQIDLP